MKYEKYPYKARYPDATNPDDSFYAFFREHGKKKRRSLGTRNERIADKKFNDLCELLDKGVLGFSLRPKPLNFVEFARTYLKEGTHDLADASVLRHRLNLFRQQKDKKCAGQTYLEKRGHLIKFFGSRDFKSIGVKDVLAYIRKRQNAGAAANTILKELATLSAMFQFAVSEELVLSNPTVRQEAETADTSASLHANKARTVSNFPASVSRSAKILSGLLQFGMPKSGTRQRQRRRCGP
jgi:Phage integrase, N-terminal SAM-like domain